MTQNARTITLGVVIVVVLGLVFYFESQKPLRNCLKSPFRGIMEV